jgi:hypothetical protein
MINYKIFWIKSLINQTFFVIVLLSSFQHVNAAIGLKGFVDSYHAVRIKAPHDYLSSRNRARLEMVAENENALAFVSFNGVKNQRLPSQCGIELREAYLDYVADSWDARIGRQIVVWGKADGIQITDIVSPMDYTEFLAQDYDDIRIPVDAFKIRFFRDVVNYEFIWVPNFQAAILPSGDNPWAIETEIPGGKQLKFDDPLTPKQTLENSEIGGKVSLYLPGFDMALSALYTWDKFPEYRKSASGDDCLRIRPEHHRITFVGAEFSRPHGSFVIRGESAFFKDKRLESDMFDNQLFKKNMLKWLIGLDWYPGNSWTVSAQFTDTYILDYDDDIDDDSHTMFSTINVSKKLFREKLKLSSFAYVGLNNGDVFDRSSIDYAFTDAFHLSTGIDLFIGDEGLFGQYKDNNEVWLKAKYSF